MNTNFLGKKYSQKAVHKDINLFQKKRETTKLEKNKELEPLFYSYNIRNYLGSTWLLPKREHLNNKKKYI